MATVGELLILIAGNNAPLTASLAASNAELRAFSAGTAAQSGVAASGLLGVGVAAAAMASATVLATAASIGAASSFQEQLGIINTIAHQTPEELNRTGESIRAMAVSSGEPLSELSAAFYDLLSAGVAPAQAMSVLQQSTTLAIGGLATTKQTVDLLTTAMNAYGLTTAQVAVATDQFALAVQDGKVTADQIAATFGDVAPIAKTAGIGIDEIAAAYAVMTSRGVPATEVTTQMNRAIQELLKPHAALNDLQEKTGQNFAQIASDQGLVTALQAMRDAAAENDVPFQNLFGRQEAFKFALATTGPEVARYRDELTAMHSATGTAAAQAAERMDTLSRQGQILGQTVLDLGIEIGTGFLPQVTAFVKGISEAVAGVSAWARENPGLAGNLLLVVGAISAITAAVVFLGPIVRALATAFGLLTSPVTLVAGAVAALAAHFGLLGEGPKAFVDGLAASLSSLIPATGPVRDAFNLIGDAIGALPAIVSGAQSVIGDFATTVQGVWSAIGPDVIAGISGAFSTFAGIVGTVAGAIGPLIGQIVSFVTSAGFAKAVVDGISTAFAILRGVFDAIVGVVSTIVGWITTFVTHLTGAKDTGAAANVVFGGLATVLQIIGNVLNTVFSIISTVITAIIDVGTRTGAFTFLLGGLKVIADAVGTALGLIGDVLHIVFTVVGLVADAISGGLTLAFNVIKGVIQTVADIVQGLIDALKQAIDLGGKVGAAVTGPSGGAKDFQDRFREINGRNPTRGEFEQYQAGNLPGYATGGVVPGPVGAPQLAIVHGGETITPAGQSGGSMALTTHTHVHLDGREIAEIIERQLFDSAANYSSGFVGSPQTT